MRLERHFRWIWAVVLTGLLAFALGPSPVDAQNTGCSNPYTVKSGDSWWLIASRCGVSRDALRRANPSKWRSGGALKAGEQLTIPRNPVQFPPVVPPVDRPAGSGISPFEGMGACPQLEPVAPGVLDVGAPEEATPGIDAQAFAMPVQPFLFGDSASAGGCDGASLAKQTPLCSCLEQQRAVRRLLSE